MRCVCYATRPFGRRLSREVRWPLYIWRLTVKRMTPPTETKNKIKIKFKAVEHVCSGLCQWKRRCIPSAYSKMPMGGDVRKFIRSLNGSVTIDCREDDVSDLFINPFKLYQSKFVSYLAAIMSVSSVLNDQNAACSRTGYTPFWEMSLLSARRRIILTFFFFFFFLPPPHTRRLFENP